MQECWYALLLAILSGPYLTPEKAFEFLSAGKMPIAGRRQTIIVPRSDTADMIKLKQEGLSYKAVGEIYGLDATSVWRRVKREERFN